MRQLGRRMLGAFVLLTAGSAAGTEIRLLESSLAPATSRVVRDETVPDGERVGPLSVLLEPGPATEAVRAAWRNGGAGSSNRATTAEVAALYGASPGRYARVRAWLKAAGLRVLRESPHRATITVDGPARAVRAAFGIDLIRGRLAGRRVRVPTGAARVPADLGVRGVIGLDDLPRFRPLHRAAARLAPGIMALDATDFAVVYRTGALLAAGHRGEGVSIAIVARSNFLDADVGAFADRFTSLAPRAPVRVFAIPGVDPGLGAPEDEIEALLDVQWAGAVAPDAVVHVVIASQEADVPAALEAAVENRVGDIVSISFGLCEPFAGAIVAEFFHELYARAALQGQTIVVAAGDAGATDCAPDDVTVAVNALAASPYAVAVGGTALDPAFDDEGRATAYGGEAAWNDDFGAGGGGVSGLFGPPEFQAALGYRAGRAVPDVSLAASPLSPGYAMVHRGQSLVVGGTSVGAPAMAGLVALAAQMRGEALGHILPRLYRLAGAEEGGSSALGAFHDVVEGSNGFAAAPGFDLATGWGTPVGESFVPALAAAAPGSCEPTFTCSIPGAPPADGCLLQWSLPGVALQTGVPGLPSRAQRCRDGETCDLDGAVNKSCTIAVSLCMNVVDPRLRTKRGERACWPQLLGAPRILRPRARAGPVATENRRRLEASLGGLPPPPIGVREPCTAAVPIEVPVPVGSSFGTATLRVRASRKRGAARAKVALVCERAL